MVKARKRARGNAMRAIQSSNVRTQESKSVMLENKSPLVSEDHDCVQLQEVDSDVSEEEESSLAKRMKENMEDNAAFFAQLGLNSAKLQFDEIKNVKKHSPSNRGFKEKRRTTEVITERRRSLRIQRKDPQGVGLPEIPSEPSVDEYARKCGPIEMTEILKVEDEDGCHEKFLKTLNDLKPNIKYSQKDSSLKDFLKTTSSMSINEFRVAKVVPQRIFSVALHPTTDKILAAAGDKRGNIGLWDVDSKNNQDGVFCYSPHSAPVKHLCFRSRDHRLYSASYDGSLRSANFEKGIFDEIYVTPEEDNILVTGFDFFSENSIVISQGHGGLVMSDIRESLNKFTLHEIHPGGKTTRSVSIHPLHTDYIATAHADSNVFIWDVRKLDQKKPKYVHHLQHNRIVESAFFSPITGRHLVTTSDDYRLYNTANVGSEAKLEVNIRHNNHTGRWLSKFRAVWHPAREDVFISGSMNRPRQIELFDNKGVIVKTFANDDYLCSVCSLNAFHPTRNVLIGGNSSGRVHVFK